MKAMRDVNEATVVGTVNRPVRVNPTKNGSVANVSVETKQIRGDKSFSTYHDVTCWNDLADVAATLKEGDRVFVTGRMTTDSWEKDGVKQYKKILTASSFGKITQGADSSDSVESKPAASSRPQGGPPGSGFSGGKADRSVFPYVDNVNKISWDKPDASGFSYAGKGGEEYCVSWANPKDPTKGGTLYILKDEDGWSESGFVGDDSDIPF
mgnify:CR=1 FL=1